MAIIQRFGAVLNLNVHVHALVLDGVYVEDGRGMLRFRAAQPPRDEEMDRLIQVLDRRIHRLLVRRGVVDVEEGSAADAWREEEPVLAGMAAASGEGRCALGERAGAAVVKCGASPDQPATVPWNSVRVTRAGAASTCTPPSWYRHGIGLSSNVSAGTRCVRPWRRTGCT